VDELGLGAVVELPDRAVPITQVATELASVHIGLVPSHRDPWTERVLPTKLLEYAAMGIPVITFRNPIIEGCFPEDAVTYVDPVSSQSLRAAMLGLANDPERARQQAARALDAMKALTWEHQRGIYLDVVDRVCGRGRIRHGTVR
jgi:glycosyltransferase involved in cell wall biosynthesis